MNGIPKFLLPLDDDLPCLVDYHVGLMKPNVDRIIIPTRPEWAGVLRGFGFGPSVDVVEVSTKTMAETLRTALSGITYDSCVLGMPDTYFVEDNPYQKLAEQPESDLKVWAFPTRSEQVGKVGSVQIDQDNHIVAHADKEPERDFGRHWGVMEFKSSVEGFLDPGASTGGYLIDECLSRGLDVRGFTSNKPYFDCGTISEYRQCLSYLENR